MKRITCGIVGYAGNGEALPILLDGLSRLEYVHPEAYAAGELKHAYNAKHTGSGGNH